MPDTQVYRANSLYDPNFSGGGHRVLGFDQIMPLYDHYTVIGSRIKVTCVNTDPDNVQNVILHLSDTTTLVTDTNRILENGQNRWKQLGIQGSGNESAVLTLNCNISKFLGRKVMQNSDCRGDVGSNPVEGVFFHITTTPSESANSLPVRVLCEIEYIAILTEPKVLSTS